MNKRISLLLVGAMLLVLLVVATAHARGTRYFIAWPKNHIGPVYVQIFDIRCNAPYELLDRFKVWVTWGDKTKCYEIGNFGTYTIKMYKKDYEMCPMMISGVAASFKIRYSLTPPWI